MINGLRMKMRAQNEAWIFWDANVEPNVTGYRVYHGTASGQYSGQIVALGTYPQYTWRGLPLGMTHYFAVTAFNDLGRESDLSAEVSKQF